MSRKFKDFLREKRERKIAAQAELAASLPSPIARAAAQKVVADRILMRGERAKAYDLRSGLFNPSLAVEKVLRSRGLCSDSGAPFEHDGGWFSGPVFDVTTGEPRGKRWVRISKTAPVRIEKSDPNEGGPSAAA